MLNEEWKCTQHGYELSESCDECVTIRLAAKDYLEYLEMQEYNELHTQMGV